MDELVLTVVGQQVVTKNPESHHKANSCEDDEDERRGKRARRQAAIGSRSKAMKSLVGGIASGTASQRQYWGEALIPRSDEAHQAHPDLSERRTAKVSAWGKGCFRQAKSEMRECGRQRTGIASLPHFRLKPLSAPGPTGDRQEHLDAITDFPGAGQRRKVFRALDTLTVRWAIGDLPDCCRWLLDTQLMFLRKERELVCKHFSDEEWTRWRRCS